MRKLPNPSTQLQCFEVPDQLAMSYYGTAVLAHVAIIKLAGRISPGRGTRRVRRLLVFKSYCMAYANMIVSEPIARRAALN